MKKILLLTALSFFSFVAFAQQNFWKQVNESAINKNLFANRYRPQSYLVFQLNDAGLKNNLLLTPSDKTVSAKQSGFILMIPNPDGQMERYRVVEAPVMDPVLAAKYPTIKSYAGSGIDDASSTIRFSMAPDGFHGMILSAGRTTIYIDPVDLADDYYVVFSRKEMMNYANTFQCMTQPAVNTDALSSGNETMRAADDGRLRTFRLALACTGEYSQYFLNGSETSDAERKAKVLAAMNTVMTRTNGIYERDFGIRMNLVSNNDAIIYLNASSDPWTSEYNTKTQQTIDAVIGNANYDIGHLFHRGSNNGNAGCIGCVCKTGQKGSAFTSHTTPEGDPFVVDYSTHEMGHQFGANHTFTFSNESGTASQFEPGSGSTIMGYAGITGATDVQPHSDDYFHARSIEQISDYIKSGTGGGACAVVTITGNTAPTVSAGADFVIPKSTPFILTGSASDPNSGDVLTYTWEQRNAGTSSTTNPSTTATSGPLFRSRTGSTSPSRTFPILSSILDGTNGNQWERLAGVARTLNFRVMVRDNHAGGGNTKDDDMIITVNGTAGPFAVSAPNTAVSWAGNSSQTVTWTVNSTNLAPVNCANVKISISVDGGNNFSTLVATTPNDGTEVITVPNTPSSTARIKIEAVGNIFFDISNVNFTITSGTGCGNPGGLSSSAITTSSATISWSPVSGANSYDADYKLNSSSTWINAATSTTSTSVNLSGLNSGSLYDWRVRTNCTSGSSAYSQAQFTTTSDVTCNAPTGLTSSGITSNSATVNWNAATGAVSYDVDYKTSSSGVWVNAVTGTTSTSRSITGLSASTTYDWRVRTNCSSSSSSYSTAQFTTNPASGGCLTNFEPNESLAAAATISTNTAVSAGIGSTTDKDWYKFTLSATSNLNITLTNLPGDYDIILYNSAGTEIKRSENGGSSSETIVNNSTATGTYYLQVFGYNGAFSTTVCYNLNVGASTATGCSSSYDNTTNGTSGGAAQIPLNTNITGLISPSGDNDYYRFVITTGGTATITLTTLPADYDIRLYSSNGTTQLAISQNGSTSSETITRTYTAGTYYVRVYGYNGANSATSCYTLRVATGTATRAETEVEYTQKPKLHLFPNPVSKSLNVNISGINEKAIINVFDIHGRMLISTTVIQSNTVMNVEKLAGGIYFIKLTDMNGVIIDQSKFVKE